VLQKPEMFAYLFAAPSIIGIPANIAMLFLTPFKSPEAFKKYSRIMFCAALCDLIGATALPLALPRSVSFHDATILEYNGFCTFHSVQLCWAASG
ncbi:hypothetical protein PENTCL1PPCAC_5562, partial [Pristionchus entomophagus]